MKKLLIGLAFGISAGIIDVILIIRFQNLFWDAIISALLMWTAIGIFISYISFKLPGIVKGIIISFMVLLPSLILITSFNILEILLICLKTLLLGSLIGFFIEYCKKKLNAI